MIDPLENMCSPEGRFNIQTAKELLAKEGMSLNFEGEPDDSYPKFVVLHSENKELEVIKEIFTKSQVFNSWKFKIESKKKDRNWHVSLQRVRTPTQNTLPPPPPPTHQPTLYDAAENIGAQVQFVRNIVIPKILRELGIDFFRHKTVLDIECGYGAHTYTLGQPGSFPESNITLWPFSVVGLESDEETCKKAVKLFHFSEGTTIIHENAADYHRKNPDNKFDVVTSFLVAENINPKELLDSMEKLSPPDGTIIISSFYPKTLNELTEIANQRFRDVRKITESGSSLGMLICSGKKKHIKA